MAEYAGIRMECDGVVCRSFVTVESVGLDGGNLQE